MLRVPIECMAKEFFHIIQDDWSKKNVLATVNKEFNQVIQYNLKIFDKLMKVPLDFKTSIAYFIGRESNDFIDYLVGTSKIVPLSYYDQNIVEKELKKNTIDNDELGSQREYCPVIVSGIFPGYNYGSAMIWDGSIDISYNNDVKYFRNPNQEIEQVEDTFPIKELTSDEVLLLENQKYWIYVLELDCRYGKTYTYVILPYYDPNMKTYNKQRVHTIYDAVVGKDFELEDDYQ
jgi:hypothetical protein